MARFEKSYAFGPIRSTAPDQQSTCVIGGLLGFMRWGSIYQSYSAGKVENDCVHARCDMGGLVAVRIRGGWNESYWDSHTSGQSRSDAGTGVGTAILKARLPDHFSPDVWTLTPKVTYPYVRDFGFQAPLAAMVLPSSAISSEIFTFLPFSQFDAGEYSADFQKKGRASLAAVFAMLGRAIGVERNVGDLKKIRIDAFWDYETNGPRWKGTLMEHASLGTLTHVPHSGRLDSSDVIGPLRHAHPVILHGYYTANRERRPLTMLATSFTLDSSGAVVRVVADDPWTGGQVRIDPATKRVTFPANFPLTSFQVEAYEVVTIHPAPTTSASHDSLCGR